MNRSTFIKSRLLRPAIAGLLGVALPASLVLPALPLAAAENTSQLNSAVAALRGISTLKADFVQTDRNGQRVKGQLTIKQPGKLRFEYEKGYNLLIVANGNSLTMIDYDVRQVERWPIKNAPLGALLDPNRDVAQYGKLQPTASPDVISVLVKDPAKPEYGEITLLFVRKAGAPGGFELASWIALDAQNNRTTVRLTNHQYGVAVADSAFRWTDPRVTTRRPR